MDIRPDSQTLAINYVVTLGILAAVVFFSFKGNPRDYYYGSFGLHSGGYPVECRVCHPRGFQPATRAGCASSTCHEEFQTGTKPDVVQVYDERWASVRERENASYVKQRRLHANVSYHHLAGIEEQDCLKCHTEHRLPESGRWPKISHRDDQDPLPKGLRIAQCSTCHTPVQAPPIVAHAGMTAGGAAAACETCHLSAKSWTEKVNWVGMPPGRSRADASLSASSSPQAPLPEVHEAPVPAASQPPDAAPSMATATPRASEAPTAAPTAPPTATPAPTAQPTATPHPIRWNQLWHEYNDETSLASDPPVLFFFYNKESSASNTFEVRAERQQKVLRILKDKFTPVRVNLPKNPELVKLLNVTDAPFIVRLDKSGRKVGVFLPTDGLDEQEFTRFLTE